MFKKLAFVLILFLLVAPAAAQAQDQPPLASVEVALWPEFDRPVMLVIYRITLSGQVSLPLKMSLPIPAEAGAPNAVAVKQPDGSLISIPYEQKADGDQSRLEFQATTSEVQVEYYDPGLLKSDDLRSFNFTWLGGYAVDSFNIEIQRPVGASELQVKPGMLTAQQGSDGLMYYRMNVGALPLGQSFQVSLQYKKSTDELSASNMPVEPSAPLDEPATGRVDLTSVLPWILGGLGLLLIAGGGFWYWQSGRQKPVSLRERHRRRKPAAQPFSAELSEGKIYCHQCGKRASPGDRFCRACGTELRIG